MAKIYKVVGETRCFNEEEFSQYSIGEFTTLEKARNAMKKRIRT